jgi:hypothetical protein
MSVRLRERIQWLRSLGYKPRQIINYGLDREMGELQFRVRMNDVFRELGRVRGGKEEKGNIEWRRNER